MLACFKFYLQSCELAKIQGRGLGSPSGHAWATNSIDMAAVTT